jgi:hypothetical protein
MPAFLKKQIYLALLALQAAAPSKTSPPNIPLHAASSTVTSLFSLPIDHTDAIERSSAIQVKREGFLYGESICGNVSYWPTGFLGNSTTARDLARFLVDSQHSRTAMSIDENVALTAVRSICNMKSNIY